MTWVWGAEQEQAFEDIKEGLISAPVLGHLMPDKPTISIPMLLM
jgi:hypothetical protein